MSAREQISFCRICEASCGIRVRVEDGRVREILPDPDHPVSRGYVCIKGVKYADLHESPDRLKHPLKRVGERWERVSWELALSEIGERLARIRRAYGPHAIGMYIGNPTAFSMTHPIFAHGFARAIGTRNVYSAGSQDCNNKFVVAERMYGSPGIQPIPDLDRTKCLVLIGSNPAVSHMSFVNVPRPVERLREIERRGGRVWIVDPRRTETAKQVGTHVPVRPDTDVWLLLSFLDELARTGGIDRARAERHMRGLDAALAIAREWPAERTADVTGVAPETLRAIVASYREADGAALYCSTGLNQGSQGTLAFWVLNVINAASGNLDRDGGVVVSRGIVDMPRIAKRIGFGHGRARSRIGGYAQVLDTLPAGVLPDEITTPGDGRIRAMVVTAGNPVLSCPDEARMREALSGLELLVSIDLFRNETGNLAHYVLPALSFLERPDVPIGIHGMQPTPYLQYTDAVVAPDGEQRDEHWIYTELAHAAGLSLFGSRAARAFFAASRRIARLPVVGRRLAFDPEKLARGIARAAGTSLRQLRERPSGVLLAPNRGGTFLGRRVLTDDGRVDLAPTDFVARARADLAAAFETKRERGGKLELISRRERTTHNTWMHNVPHFVRGDRATNYLYMHPDDAERAGVRDGALAEIAANGASVRATVKVTPDLTPGTVTLPHGWGHDAADGLRVAQSAPGVNPNRLAKSGASSLERLAGMTHLNGIPVDVRPVRPPAASPDRGRRRRAARRTRT